MSNRLYNVARVMPACAASFATVTREIGCAEASSTTARSRARVVRSIWDQIEGSIGLYLRIQGFLCTLSSALIQVSISGPSDTKGTPMSSHSAISPTEAADRLAIRELIDAYAHCADRRDAKGQMALFTEDTHFVVFMDATSSEPSQELHGRDSLFPVFDNLNTYTTTTHFNGQSTVVLQGDRGTGESYCLAHHVFTDAAGQRTLMIASIRYLDEFAKREGKWLFAERRLMVDWTETRASTP